MNINLGKEIEYSSKSRHIYGRFNIAFDEFMFPDEEWTDFVYPVLDWWSNEFIKSYKQHLDMHLLFMDGEFSVVASIKEQIIYFNCFNNYIGNGSALKNAYCSLKSFRDSLSKGLEVCYQVFCNNNDVDLSNKCYNQICLLSQLF